MTELRTQLPKSHADTISQRSKHLLRRKPKHYRIDVLPDAVAKLDTLSSIVFCQHLKQTKTECSRLRTLQKGLKTFVLYTTSKSIRASK